MSLSVCLLTRNEERSLDRALRSVVGVADEIVVADTGSTDRTVAIAAELGARVSRHAWADDFSAARNFALGQARGDWVLWLNPDEEVLPESLVVLRQCLAQADAFAFGVRVLDLLRGDPPDLFTETGQVRLFRRRPELHFVGRLYPSLQPPVEELAANEGKRVLMAPEVVIRRHAYLSQLDESKLRWAARLLELELRDRPGQLTYVIEYGRTLLLLNDPKGHEVLAEAADQVALARDAAQPPSPAVQRLLEYLLTITPGQSRSRLGREEARELAHRWFPASPPLLWQEAAQFFQAEDYPQAAALLEKLVELGRTGRYDRSEGFDPTILGPAALLNLGTSYAKMNEYDKAERCLLALLAVPSHRAQAAANLNSLRQLREQPPAPPA